MAKAKKSTSSKTKASKSAAKTKSPVKAKARKNTTKTAAKAPTASKKVSNTQPVLEYKLFCEDSVRNLEDQVNYHISKGWSPVGGVVLQGQHNFMQTMIRQQS